jgi:hypothetical protein
MHKKLESCIDFAAIDIGWASCIIKFCAIHSMWIIEYPRYTGIEVMDV